MMRRSYVLLILLLVMAMAATGCGRYTETVKESETPGTESPPAIGSSEPTGGIPAPSENPVPVGEFSPFAESRGHELVYGYMDGAGYVAIQPQYASARPFYACGLAIVSDASGKSGLIDRTGRFVVSPEADAIIYSDGVFVAHSYSGGNDRVYDENGVLLFERSDYIFDFSDGLSIVYGQSSRGYMDKSGKMVLELPYASLGDFYDGVAVVSPEYDGPSLLIDKQGNDLTDKLSSGLRMIEDNGLFGFEDKDGNVVIEPRFSYARPFRDGLAIVGVDRGYSIIYGIIDTQGNYVLEPEYCVIQRMRNGSFAVGERLEEDAFVPSMYPDYSKRALFSKDLSKHTDWIFYELDSLDGKYTCVSDGVSIFYMDADLNRAADLPQFSGRGLMLADGSWLRGTINGHLTVADRAGSILAKDEGLTFLESGVMTRTVTEYYHDYSYTDITYPVLDGLKDEQVQEQLNRMIAEEARGYVKYYEPDPENPYFLPVISVYSSVLLREDLLHIDMRIDEYWLGAAHPLHYWSNVYVNTRDGRIFTLDDLFKSPDEGRLRLSEKVTEAMKKNPEAFFEDSVRPDQIQFFHLEEDGIIVYFAEYEIAAYAAGMPEFYIPFSEIMDLIDTEGDFWNSFN